MRFTIPAILLVAACTPPPAAPTIELPFFGNGYRFDGDQCRRLGESDFTGEFLGDASDLIGCPEDLENLGVFVIDSGAVEVARVGGFILYSVPTG